MKPKLLVSFSAGRSSAYMLCHIWARWRNDYDILVVFANTGKEVAGTLEFVRDVGRYFSIPIVLVEYTKNPKAKGAAPICDADALTVTYETLSRAGEPFERLIAAMGIPNSTAPFCTTYLKNRTIKAYLRAIGWFKYYTAIGIRADETGRVSVNASKERLIYPLIESDEWPNFGNVNKDEVLDWWSAQVFDLDIHADDGNCDNCWKKNFNLLTRNAIRKPASFDWWRLMETKYKSHNPRNNGYKPPYNFYRGGLSVDAIFFLAEHADAATLDKMAKQRNENGCGESCEAF